MEILQGQYLKGLKTKKGSLKALEIQTEQGQKTVQLPEYLRAIAQQELALGDTVRLWVEPDKKAQKQAKKLNKKTSKKKAAKKSRKLSKTKPVWQAVQIIPLSPKAVITAVKPAAQAVKKKRKKAQRAGLTVQVCQKKNCCKKGGDTLWQALEIRHDQPSPQAEAASFKLESVGCLGGCKNGPNIRVLPDNVKYRSVKPAQMERILQKHA